MADRKLNLYAADIAPNDRVEGSFLVKRKFYGIGKTGKPWLSLTLMDKSGEIDGRIWDDADEANAAISEGDYVLLEGIGTQYMDRVQLKVTRWRHLDPSSVDPADYLPVGEKSREEMLARLDAVLQKVTNRFIRALLDSYRRDNVFMDAFCTAPAAKSIHHAYIGGLLDHTVSMMELAVLIADHYENSGQGPVSRDLLVAGAFLHDSGKVWEISRDPGFPYTRQGQMIGHIHLGLRDMERRIAQIDGFPEDLYEHLAHLVLSHHGEHQWGAPVVPKTIEALILHAIDNLDSRVQIFNEAVAMPRGKGAVDEGASVFAPAMDRHLLVKPWQTGEGDEK